MRFRHAPDIWNNHPTLAVGVILASGITTTPDVQEQISGYAGAALQRLAKQPISEIPEIRAWRRAFATMGLKPTQYRCASESLLRRLHKDGELPSIHPLVDLCNHISAAYAIPVAALDLKRITGNLEVRHANGSEQYLTLAGDIEYPTPGEVIFADDAGQAHARRWTNRQSAISAIGETTTEVLIVIEALHENADADIDSLITTLTHELGSTWHIEPTTVRLGIKHSEFSTSPEE